MSLHGDKREVTLQVGVVSGLNIAVETSQPQENVEIPLILWIHAAFAFREKIDTERKYPISIRLSNSYHEPVVKTVEIIQKPNQEFLAVNMQWVLNEKGSRPRFTIGRNFIKVSFRYKSTDLGMIELPIDVSIQTAEKG